MKNVYSGVCVLALSALFQAGCAVAPSAAWLNDFNAAKKTAARQNKNILLFFSADDDTESARLKENV
ncbi:thioredoxin family protein [Treponema endosymbiont of Eucomonympha sp.]|uniref:thioredoxin family protein n=1 Tax=Treponema endosymbiont of Eucomonympha sp. TaxID=1580831 RepID=UPI00075198D3|nr:thioredoxin family protein [Treponema endosymbiont of Eucomonympha sp.]